MRALGLLPVAAFGSGCVSFSSAHRIHTPLLNAEHQLDLAAHVGDQDGTVMVAAQGAYSPLPNFEVLANVDLTITDEREAHHAGGGLGVGIYTSTPVLRAELIGGANVGLGQGWAWTPCTATPSGSGCVASSVDDVYRLDGAYIAPYVQGLIGFEVPFFELAGGVRLWGWFSSPTTTRVEGDGPTSVPAALNTGYLEPVITIRVPIEFVRIEVLTSVGFRLSNRNEWAVSESPVMLTSTLGVGFQFGL